MPVDAFQFKIGQLDKRPGIVNARKGIGSGDSLFHVPADFDPGNKKGEYQKKGQSDKTVPVGNQKMDVTGVRINIGDDPDGGTRDAQQDAPGFIKKPCG